MKKHMVLSFVIIIIISALPCLAMEYKGEIIKMNESRLELRVKGEGNRSFRMTKLTRVYMEGGITNVHRLSPKSKVRVVENNDRVELIIVEEVPK
jgi:hypothetical protein